MSISSYNSISVRFYFLLNAAINRITKIHPFFHDFIALWLNWIARAGVRADPTLGSAQKHLNVECEKPVIDSA